MNTAKPARATRRSITRALEAVRGERYRQVAKWDDSTKDHPDMTGLPGDAEEAEHAKLLTDLAAAEGCVSWRHILWEEVREAFAENDPHLLRTELVQVAAVAVKWVEAIDRRAEQ